MQACRRNEIPTAPILGFAQTCERPGNLLPGRFTNPTICLETLYLWPRLILLLLLFFRLAFIRYLLRDVSIFQSRLLLLKVLGVIKPVHELFCPSRFR